jgi:cyclohexyl-isocyanide hydratase
MTRLQIVVLLFPNVTQLDMTGPAQVFSHFPDTDVHVAWHNLEPVTTDCGWSIVPTITLNDAPQADLLFVPGGQGAFELFEDTVALDFLRTQSSEARWVTSVCTGSFALAAAGLLSGKKATSHWASLSMLSEFGCQPVSERVVRDGNMITGAGVTSGIDFALTVAAEIFGDEVARRIQLLIEYDPAPPFDAGTPRTADPDFVEKTKQSMRTTRLPLIARALERG